MRTLVLAALAAMTVATGGTAEGAGRRAPAPSYSWGGCYIGAGAGYGMYNEDMDLIAVKTLPGIPAGTTFVSGLTQGGRGWLATGQFGCDYQLPNPWASDWVIGAFVDADFTNITGQHTGGNVNIGLQHGDERERWSWAFGARLGRVIRPQMLAYVSAGYTEAMFDAVNYVSNLFPSIGVATGLQLPSRIYQGWFVGAGVEYALDWLPGLSWKTEYRFADYRNRTDTVLCTAAACGAVGPTSFGERIQPFVQTVRTGVAWKFDWGSLPSVRH